MERVKAIDGLTMACKAKGLFSQALEAARLGASKTVIKKLLKSSIKSGEYEVSKELAFLLRRKLTLDELKEIRGVHIKKGWLLKGAILWQLESSNHLFCRLLKFQRREVDKFQAVMILGIENVKPEFIEGLIKNAVNDGNVRQAQRAVRFTGRELSIQEIQVLTNNISTAHKKKTV